MNEAPVSPSIALKLVQTQPWIRFIAIMMFVGMGLMVLGGLFCICMGSLSLAGIMPAGPTGGAMLLLIGIMYLMLAGLYLFPALHLLRSARAIRELGANPSEETAVAALEHQRRFWKFVGIALIVLLVFYVLAIAAAIIIPMIAGIQKAAQHAR